MDKKTAIIHCGVDRDPQTGAAGVPLYLASTYHQPDVAEHQEYAYSRVSNPTRGAVEKALAELEGGAAAFAFSSGMAAIASSFLLFRPGDHVLVADALYGGTFTALTKLFSNWGLEATFVDMTDLDAVKKAIRPATKCLYIETPSNPHLAITDLAGVAAIAREYGLLTMIDNTFATPYLQTPMEFGFDLVLHSATKFLNGHSDVLGGFIVARTPELAQRIHFLQVAFGAVLGVSDSWLLLRGLRTLAVRMEASQASAAVLAQKLSELPEVKAVFYPTLPGHPGRDIHMRQARGGGAVLSFELRDGAMAREFLRRVTLPLVAVSLGGVESIMSYPVTMSHGRMPEEERLRRGITDSLIRFSVGLEAPEDLLADITAALAACRS
ncbi:Cystathionine beta-lyase MetC [uncultured delta proteobacterium]|uniref:cysteine-S-conjugate beta-lyase n=1 Tax=uncultured delta proteobacterium TaxID=34034 RepID=A0A212J2Q3_9DELT|nr:Cystathionine beta-lyase MetC [uncultured delta proteobacterium]